MCSSTSKTDALHIHVSAVSLRDRGVLRAMDEGPSIEFCVSAFPLLGGRGGIVGGVIHLRLTRIEYLCSEKGGGGGRTRTRTRKEGE